MALRARADRLDHSLTFIRDVAARLEGGDPLRGLAERHWSWQSPAPGREPESCSSSTSEVVYAPSRPWAHGPC